MMAASKSERKKNPDSHENRGSKIKMTTETLYLLTEVSASCALDGCFRRHPSAGRMASPAAFGVCDFRETCGCRNRRLGSLHLEIYLGRRDYFADGFGQALYFYPFWICLPRLRLT